MPEVWRDGSGIISTKFDPSQSGALPVRHHPVDPYQLVSSQAGAHQVDHLQGGDAGHQDVRGD